MAGDFYKNFTMGTVVLSDGTGTPLTITLDIDNGDVSLTGVTPGLRNSSDYQRKGQYQCSAFTDRAFPTLSFTANMAEFTDTSSGTLIDFIFAKSGTPYGARIPTIAPAGATAARIPFTCDFQLTIEGTNFGDGADHVFGADNVKMTVDFAEGDPNTFTINGTVLGALTDDWAVTEA